MRLNAYAAWSIPLPGTIVGGKYEVETECGRDGLAAILSAVDLGLGRRVVIRVLLPQWADDPQAIEQFRRDGRAAARAASDASPRLFDLGKLDNGAPYQVLDYLGEHEFSPADRSSSPERIPGVRGSDRVVASALLMLGALGTAAFMWLYSTVHENDGHKVGVTLMQPTTNILDQAGAADGGVDTRAAATTMGGSALANVPSRVTQGGVADAGPFGNNAAPTPAAVPPLTPGSQATPSPSDPRTLEGGSDGRTESTRAQARTSTEPHRPPRTVVHVAAAPAPTPAADPENPYDTPGTDTARDESSRARARQAVAPGRFSNQPDDGAESQDRLLDRRE
jgi:hypothetical protein